MQKHPDAPMRLSGCIACVMHGSTVIFRLGPQALPSRGIRRRILLSAPELGRGVRRPGREEAFSPGLFLWAIPQRGTGSVIACEKHHNKRRGACQVLDLAKKTGHNEKCYARRAGRGEGWRMEHEIIEVSPHGAAARHGVRVGDRLTAINGEPVLDEIDYQALSSARRLRLELLREGKPAEIEFFKAPDEPLGLRFGPSMALSPRTCRNNCVFCFISQMPPGLRPSLYMRDDDWRYSLMMGNFVTLTNVNEAEFQRLLKRKASPLYISVHTTDPGLRCRMMNNRHAGDILKRLERLKAHGLRFHCQVVVCPGYNDGPALMRTLEDLRALAPAARTVALVPVGLTRFRDGLTPLTPFTPASARALLDQIAPFQEACRRELGTTFVFPSDEFFCLADRPIPPQAWYEDFAQIENGVGLLRRFACELEDARRFGPAQAAPPPRKCVVPTGVSAAPHLRRLAAQFGPDTLELNVLAVPNRFFGQSVTVAGLLTGGDVLAALTPQAVEGAQEIWLSRVMLRHEGDLFLDDMHIDEFRARAPLPVRLLDCDGQAFYDALWARGDERP